MLVTLILQPLLNYSLSIFTIFLYILIFAHTLCVKLNINDKTGTGVWQLHLRFSKHLFKRDEHRHFQLIRQFKSHLSRHFHLVLEQELSVYFILCYQLQLWLLLWFFWKNDLIQIRDQYEQFPSNQRKSCMYGRSYCIESQFLPCNNKCRLVTVSKNLKYPQSTCCHCFPQLIYLPSNHLQMSE